MTFVLDSGALIALERGDPRMVAVIDQIKRSQIAGHAPAGVVAQVWRNSPRQHALITLVRSAALHIDSLDDVTALAIGARLASTRTSDVIDAHVAILARRVGGTVITSDPDDIRALDSSLRIVPI